MNIQVIGIDLGKSSFHLVGHDHQGRAQFRKKLSRPKLCEFLTNHPLTVIAFEACGGSHWLGRYCKKLGHQVKLIPPQYVKPYVKTHKNDFIDADAIAEASQRPSMRFVEVKSEQAQVIGAIHRIRSGYIKARTACMSRIGSLLLEFGVSLPTGHSVMKRLFAWLATQRQVIPPMLMEELVELHEHYQELNARIDRQERKLMRLVKAHRDGELLKSIPGVGDLTASQCLAEFESVNQFKNGRSMAAWLGLVPHQYSTGGKTKLLGISKRGDKHLRTLLIHGARAILSRLETTGTVFGDWLTKLRQRKPFNVACVALANKLARIVWSVLKYKKAFNAECLHTEFA